MSRPSAPAARLLASGRCALLAALGLVAAACTPGVRDDPAADPSDTTDAGPPASTGCAATHACALLTSGRVQCWGRNDNGQLGDGTGVSRLTAADILSP